MSILPTAAARLTRLDRILAQSTPLTSAKGGDPDPGHALLATVPLERIRALSGELEEAAGTELDAVDALTLRLLLSDYRMAVTHLRAVANVVDTRLHAAHDRITATRKFLRREQEMAAKRAAAAQRTE